MELLDGAHSGQYNGSGVHRQQHARPGAHNGQKLPHAGVCTFSGQELAGSGAYSMKEQASVRGACGGLNSQYQQPHIHARPRKEPPHAGQHSGSRSCDDHQATHGVSPFRSSNPGKSIAITDQVTPSRRSYGVSPFQRSISTTGHDQQSQQSTHPSYSTRVFPHDRQSRHTDSPLFIDDDKSSDSVFDEEDLYPDLFSNMDRSPVYGHKKSQTGLSMPVHPGLSQEFSSDNSEEDSTSSFPRHTAPKDFLHQSAGVA